MGFFIAKYARSATLVVAASDSRDKAGADYICDGIDDQTEINSAITALGATGGTVTLLEGTYNTTAPITITRNNVNLIGCGWGTIIDVAGAGVDGIVIGDGVNHYENIVVQDLQIDGTDTTGLSRGVYVRGATGVEITCVTILRCWVHHFTGAASEGIHLYYTDKSNVALNRVNDNYVGIHLARSDFNRVQSNTAEDNPHPNGGIVVGTAHHNIISGNHCRGNGMGIRIWNGNEQVVYGNICYDNATDGIAIDGTSSDNEICCNQCDNNGSDGIDIGDVTCNNNRLMYNRLQGNTVRAIVDAGTGTIIDGNWENVGHYQTTAGNWAAYAGPTGSPANGTRVIVYSSGEPGHRLYCYSNGAWHYVNLT